MVESKRIPEITHKKINADLRLLLVIPLPTANAGSAAAAAVAAAVISAVIFFTMNLHLELYPVHYIIRYPILQGKTGKSTR